MNDANGYLKRMIAIVKEGGALAMSIMDDSAPDFKNDQSIITNADKAISDLTRRHLNDLITSNDHLLIDEEDPNLASSLNPDLLKQKKYIWALDPIDGTRLYANRMPLFGVSLGLIKDLKPWLGVVYFPMLKELFYCDGVEAYYVKDAFTDNEVKHQIVPNQEIASGKSLFFCNDTFFNNFYWDDKYFHIMIHACAVVNLCWPTIGRGIGCFQRCHLWDFAGSWPIILKAGFNFYRITDGSIMDEVDINRFTVSPKPWQMKEYYLIATARNVEHIRSKIKQR